jgi:hypothetical protein
MTYPSGQFRFTAAKWSMTTRLPRVKVLHEVQRSRSALEQIGTFRRGLRSRKSNPGVGKLRRSVRSEAECSVGCEAKFPGKFDSEENGRFSPPQHGRLEAEFAGRRPDKRELRRAQRRQVFLLQLACLMGQRRGKTSIHGASLQPVITNNDAPFVSVAPQASNQFTQFRHSLRAFW